MKYLSAFVLFVVAASVVGPACAGDANSTGAKPDSELAAAHERNLELDQVLPKAADWLLEHHDQRKRAAGLLYHVDATKRIDAQAASVEKLAGDNLFRDYPSVRQAGLDALARAEARNDKMRKFGPGELLDRFEQAIRTTTDGAALAWLANACASADIEAFCIDAGLDDSIVRHDGANLFSRSALLPQADPERFEALILEADETRIYENVFLKTWFDALTAVDAGSQLDDHAHLLGAYSVALAYAVPGLRDLSQACGAAVAPGSELELACDRVLDDMAEDGDTALTQLLMPSALRARRASARGFDQRAAELEAEKQRIHQRASCAASEVEALLEDGNDSTVRQYLELLVQHGEIEGVDRFVEDHGIDCSGPEDAT